MGQTFIAPWGYTASRLARGLVILAAYTLILCWLSSPIAPTWHSAAVTIAFHAIVSAMLAAHYVRSRAVVTVSEEEISHEGAHLHYRSSAEWDTLAKAVRRGESDWLLVPLHGESVHVDLTAFPRAQRQQLSDLIVKNLHQNRTRIVTPVLYRRIRTLLQPNTRMQSYRLPLSRQTKPDSHVGSIET
jgi:hypothetical protein